MADDDVDALRVERADRAKDVASSGRPARSCSTLGNFERIRVP